MKRFRTTFFNGYQRAEVDQYIETLVQELENFKEETNRKMEADRRLIQEMKEKMETASSEKTALEQQMESLQGQNSAAGSEELDQVKEKLKEYESNYSDLASVLAEARIEAAKIVSTAKENAESITSGAKENAENITSGAKETARFIENEAKRDAESVTSAARAEAMEYRQAVEMELSQKRDEDRLRFEQAKRNITDYLEGLNRSQRKLIETYNELGLLVKKMPIRLEDVFSQKPFELLADDEDVADSSPKEGGTQ